MSDTVPDWIIRKLEDLAAQQLMTVQALESIRNERDDDRRDMTALYDRGMSELKLLLTNGLAQIREVAGYANASAEAAKKKADTIEGKVDLVAGQLQSHRGSHKLEVTEREAGLLAVAQEETKAKWSFREKAMVAIIGGLVTIITAIIASGILTK